MLVTNIQRFCMHDGPGIRTVVFLQGCPLTCKWCHNPETQSMGKSLLFSEKACIGCGLCEAACALHLHTFSSEGHLIDRKHCVQCGKCVSVCPTKALRFSSREMTEDEILEEVLRDRAFYGKDGGVTLSGGEPLLHIKEALSLLEACKKAGLHTAVETSGVFDTAFLPRLIPVVDLFLWDIKDTVSSRHQENTGVPSALPAENLRLADSMGANTVMRCILVGGQNDNEEHIQRLNALFESLQHCRKLQLLPCHMMAGGKYRELGTECSLPDSAACKETTLRRLEALVSKR